MSSSTDKFFKFSEPPISLHYYGDATLPPVCLNLQDEMQVDITFVYEVFETFYYSLYKQKYKKN